MLSALKCFFMLFGDDAGYPGALDRYVATQILQNLPVHSLQLIVIGPIQSKAICAPACRTVNMLMSNILMKQTLPKAIRVQTELPPFFCNSFSSAV